MRKLIILLIVLVILGMIFYTAETKEIIKITGKHSYNFYEDLRGSNAVDRLLNDLRERYDKIKN